MTVDDAPPSVPCDSERFWHAELELEVHSYDATAAIIDHRPDRRWRVIVDGEAGIIAYARPDAADRVVAALRDAYAS